MLKSAVLCALLIACFAGVASAAKKGDIPVIPQGPQVGSVVAADAEVLDLPARPASAPWQRRNWHATWAYCKKLDLRVLSNQICGVSVHTADKVKQGRQYRVTVTGAWNAWNGGAAATGCGVFQSKNGILASADPAFTFGTRFRPKKCRKLDWSAGFRHGSSFVFSRNDGLTYEHPTFETTPSAPQASYSFLVTGLSNQDHLYFAIADGGGVMDNLGGLSITVQKLPQH